MSKMVTAIIACEQSPGCYREACSVVVKVFTCIKTDLVWDRVGNMFVTVLMIITTNYMETRLKINGFGSK